MADLDDFFAKKDKKKSKIKKFSTTDDVAKKLDDPNKKQDKTLKKDKNQENNDDIAVEINDQDEWKDFEEEKKDYTGLKIGNLTLNSEIEGNNTVQDSNYEQEPPTYDEAGNEMEKKEKGPWKKLEEVAEQQPIVKKIQEAPTPNVVGGAYVPPSKRNQHVQPQNVQPSRIRSKTAPDIHNEEFFPTLSGVKEPPKRVRNEGGFELVAPNKSNSLKFVEQNSKLSGQGPKLSLGNRFNTLSDDS